MEYQSNLLSFNQRGRWYQQLRFLHPKRTSRSKVFLSSKTQRSLSDSGQLLLELLLELLTSWSIPNWSLLHQVTWSFPVWIKWLVTWFSTKFQSETSCSSWQTPRMLFMVHWIVSNLKHELCASHKSCCQRHRTKTGETSKIFKEIPRITKQIRSIRMDREEFFSGLEVSQRRNAFVRTPLELPRELAPEKLPLRGSSQLSQVTCQITGQAILRKESNALI